MSEFQLGDIVDITIKGVRIVGEGYDERYQSAYILVALPIGDDEAHGRIHLDAPAVAVERRPLPDNWPPKPGDLWHMENDGADPADGLFFAHLVYGPFDEHPEDRVPWVELVCATGGWTAKEPEELLLLGRWTLVRREEQDGPAGE